MNCFSLVLALNNANNAFQMDAVSTGSKTVPYSINDPTIYTNMVRIDPAVYKGIIDVSTGTN